MDKKLLLLAATLGLAACGDNGDSNNNHDYGNRREVTYLEYTGKTESATITPDNYVAIAKAAVEGAYQNVQSYNLINYGINNINTAPFQMGDGNAPVSDTPGFGTPVYHYDYNVSPEHIVISDTSTACDGSGDYYYHVLSDYSEFHYDYLGYCGNDLQINSGWLIFQQKEYAAQYYLKATFLSMYMNTLGISDINQVGYDYTKHYDDLYGSYYLWNEDTGDGRDEKKRFVIKYMADGYEQTLSHFESCDSESICYADEVFLSQTGSYNQTSTALIQFPSTANPSYLAEFRLDVAEYGRLMVYSYELYPAKSQKTFCGGTTTLYVNEIGNSSGYDQITISFSEDCSFYVVDLVDFDGQPIANDIVYQ
ncbi:hypothetical protein ABMA58_11510 [Oceanospirillum sp. HFRX-1_2]